MSHWHVGSSLFLAHWKRQNDMFSCLEETRSPCLLLSESVVDWPVPNIRWLHQPGHLDLGRGSLQRSTPPPARALWHGPRFPLMPPADLQPRSANLQPRPTGLQPRPADPHQAQPNCRSRHPPPLEPGTSGLSADPLTCPQCTRPSKRGRSDCVCSVTRCRLRG